MKKNMGGVDKIIRLIVALLVVIAYSRDIIPSPWGVILLVVSAIFVITSLVGVCPLYSIFNISSRPDKNKE